MHSLSLLGNCRFEHAPWMISRDFFLFCFWCSSIYYWKYVPFEELGEWNSNYTPFTDCSGDWRISRWILKKISKNSPEEILEWTPPLCVNVGVLINGRLEGLPQVQILVPCSIVIPIRPQLKTLKIDGGLSIKCHSFTNEFTFAMTYHKIQCQTVGKIILDLNTSPSKPLDLSSVYVGMSHVRNNSNMRILALQSVEHLYIMELCHCHWGTRIWLSK